MAKVVAALVRLPVFSIAQPESFQVLSALPVPQPSSLVGALAYALGVVSGKGTKAMEEAYSLVKNGELLAARAKPNGNEAVSPPLVPSPVVLRRFRIADKAHESKDRGVRKPVDRLGESLGAGNFDEVKKILEVELMDAFYREYVMGVNLFCVWVFKSQSLAEDVVSLIHRLGDTESLCTVVEVFNREATLTRKNVVETPFPAPWIEGARVIKGSYFPAKICNEARELSLFIIPLRQETERSGKLRYPAIRPSSVTVDYGREVNVCETEWGDIVVGR
ncbi:MAG: type I-A CRISPR-associated protein Cas5a [Thermofilaceae archaeon]